MSFQIDEEVWITCLLGAVVNILRIIYLWLEDEQRLTFSCKLIFDLEGRRCDQMSSVTRLSNRHVSCLDHVFYLNWKS